MRRLLSAVVLAGLFWAAPASSGQWNGGGYLGAVNFDAAKAAGQGVKDSADAVGGYAEFQTDSLVAVTMGGEFVVYDDIEQFSEWVEREDFFDDDTEIHRESSDAFAIDIFADAGPRWKFGQGFAAAAAGYVHTVYSERSISNCEDCRSEDIDLDGGGYAKLAGGFKAGVVNIGLTYRRFFSGEMDDAVYLTIGTAF